MKALTLYVDKWYIIGAVCTDGVPHLIIPSNHEDRFWLYFYEDTYNNSIVYGKDNQTHFQNGEPHYLGDVFSAITDPEKRFSRYIGKYEELKTIFHASGILEALHSAVNTDSPIDTYISFSPDIPGPSRLVFFEELSQNGFKVIGSQARIGFLALEHNRRNDLLLDDGYYLVLNACNENLHYILYKKEGNKYKTFSENVLLGMGVDLRGRALVETVVDSVNKSTHFLATTEEKEREYLRMEQFVQNWFVKIANARPYVPVTIPNVSFANQPANTFQVSIIKNKLDERTGIIVNNIIKVVADFVKSSGVRNDEIKGLVFIGNTFTNKQFELAIREKFVVNEENIVRHKEIDLPYIIGVYPLLDINEGDWKTTAGQDLDDIRRRSEFDKEIAILEDSIKSRLWKDARAQLDRMLNLYLDFSSELIQYKTIIDKGEKEDGNKANRLYEDAMQKVYEFENKQDFAQMIEWAEIALTHRSGDAEASQKKDDAIRLLSEQKIKEEQYRKIIETAQSYIKESRWQDALSQSDAALNIKPTSLEAKRIHQEALKHIEATKKIDKHIGLAVVLMAQKLYEEALQELVKVQALDPNNEEALMRIKEINEIRKEHQDKVATIVSQYEQAKNASDFKAAISACEQLADLDSINQKKWSKEAEKLRSEEENYQKELTRFEDLKEKVTGAYFDEKWADVIHFAKDALQIKEDEKLRFRIAEANIKLKEKEEREKYENGVHRVNELLLAEDFEEAEVLINSLRKDFPEHEVQIKALSKKLMDQQFRSLKNAPSHGPKEPDTKKPPMPKSDDFFGDGTVQKSKSSKPTPSPSKEGSTQQKKPEKVVPTEDDFFGSSNAPKSKPSKQTSTASQKKPAAPPKKPSSKGKPTGIDFFDS